MNRDTIEKETEDIEKKFNQMTATVLSWRLALAEAEVELDLLTGLLEYNNKMLHLIDQKKDMS